MSVARLPLHVDPEGNPVGEDEAMPRGRVDGEGETGRVVEASDSASHSGTVPELGLVAKELDTQVTEGCSFPASVAHVDCLAEMESKQLDLSLIHI